MLLLSIHISNLIHTCFDSNPCFCSAYVLVVYYFQSLMHYDMYGDVYNNYNYTQILNINKQVPQPTHV